MGVLLTLLATAVAAAAELQPLDEGPIRGRSTTLSFVDGDTPAAGLTVTATYRQGAHAVLQRVQEIGTTDGAGRVAWTPEQAGVVVLAWEGGTHNVSVLYGDIPPRSVAVAILAGLLLLGGSVYFFVQMIRTGRPELSREADELGEPPST